MATCSTNPPRYAEKAQVVLVKKSPNAAEVMSFLSSCGPFTCKQVDKCPVDLMFCAQARTFPAIPFMFITSATSDVVSVTKERARHATTLFPFVHAIILFPSALPPRTFRELQSLHLNQDLSDKIQIVPASSIETAVHFMLSVRSKQSFQAQERTAEFYARLWAQVESKAHTVRILQSNMPFLHEDECEMLLDVFGSIAGLSRVSEQNFLDQTVLDADVIKLLVEYFECIT
ncbi:hypothetical protein AaE_012699 [Aphanomyces astaci]|uniref:Uncharacterized protein n=1 Tax=Aphanomyces astaci TaxID=112090 RepID=A0A6A4Z792_APHAT|nr:hypothetical protein AaE_012699 [Aphanomyces astaci]